MVDSLVECEYSLFMEQLPLFDASPRWTVADLTRHLRRLLEADADLQAIWVQGEMSNLSRPSSGHIYFTLKDAGAALRCVMWRNDAARLQFDPSDGMAIEVHGSIGIYETGGQYQLYADTLRPLGEGDLYQEFLRLKALLETEGLFDPSRKRGIPDRPHRIGLVTSPTGAALRDILNTLRRRNPLVEVILAASPVQGEDAPDALVGAISTLNRIAAPDVILLARGGGSIEDLWAFNDPRVVRAVAASEAPVITGVGHETDITLVDFAADLRAPTPTAAAELATRVTVLDLKGEIAETRLDLKTALESIIERQRSAISAFHNGLRLFSPHRRVQSERQRLDELSRREASALAHARAMAAARLHGLDSRLAALGPQAVLKRGYAILTRAADGSLVSHRSQVEVSDELRVRLQDGEFSGRVTGKT